MSKLARTWINLSLRWKITILTTLLVMSAVLSVTLFSIQREKSNFKKEMESQASILLNTLSLPLWGNLQVLQTDDPGEINPVAVSMEELTQLVIFDSNGNVLVNSIRSGSSNQSLEEMARTILHNPSTEYYLSWHTDQLIAGKQISSGDQIHGGILIGLSTEPLDRKISSLTKNGFLLAIGASVIGAILSGLFGLQISLPLKKLAETVTTMAGGDFKIRTPIEYGNEIGQLGRAFNQMADAIQKREEALRDQAQNLEKNIRDRTLELRQKNEALEEIAITDGLTKIFNRRHFFNLAEKEIERARRYNHPVSVILIDTDHFKLVNDSYGHLVGDQILANLAKFLKGNIRRIDILARYGGEEFIILTPETECKNAQLSAERLRKLIENTPMTRGGVDVKITVSIGIACWDGNGGTSLDSLLAHADYALYQSKESGRNRVSVWQESPHEER